VNGWTARLHANVRLVSLVAALVASILTSCVSGSRSASGISGGKLQVVAAEDFWGSIASQLGGDRVSVTSIITNPNADPHDYEPTPDDARLIASAGYVIENGIGYDPWVQKLIDANPSDGRNVLNVGDQVGVAVGGNPHQWYAPSNVQKVIDAITAEYQKRDATHTSYFAQQRTAFETVGLKRYHDLIAQIDQRFGGTAVGASESIFEPMASALGLDLLTPPSFLKAVSEGAEPTAGDKATIDAQILQRQIKVYVYNSQNATPDIQRQIDECRAQDIPVTTITETLVPEGASFQDWQASQLQALASALAHPARP
jgi:zinc/manganese transport system substrate-binding protein